MKKRKQSRNRGELSGPRKVLFIRLSSIGDIVLTTPVIRSLKQARPDIEIHYLTSEQYRDILIHNPYVDRIHAVPGHAAMNAYETLRAEDFEYILDLHNNLRSFQLRNALPVPAARFPKANFEKTLIIHGKQKRLRIPHIVQRYGAVLGALGCPLDGNGLDFFLPDETDARARQRVQKEFGDKEPVALVIGARHETKIWPAEYFRELLPLLPRPAVLPGGPDDRQRAKVILNGNTRQKHPVLNLAGHATLLESAAMLKHCRYVITHDTGLMHVAAAFRKPQITIWGNTTPAFGMTPYLCEYRALQTRHLFCRPCDKLGHRRCPMGHHRCVRDISVESVLEAVNEMELLASRTDCVPI